MLDAAIRIDRLFKDKTRSQAAIAPKPANPL